VTSALLVGLQQCVSAPVLSTSAQLQVYSRDFGGLKKCLPLAVASVRSEEELCRAIRFLRAERVPMTLRGAGFSCHLGTLSDSVIIENRPSEDETVRLSADLVEIPARLRWRAVVNQLEASRLMPPVLTYSLSPTVGGTLSVGGFGARSIAAGAQVDQVHGLRVVLPDGEAIECSPEKNADIFRLALGGMGRIAVIERATMATTPLRPMVKLSSRRYASFAVAEEQLQTEEADYFFVECRGHDVQSHAGVSAEIQDVFSSESVVPREFFQAPSAAFGQDDVIHVWCDYFVDGSALGSMLEYLDTYLQREGLDRIHILAIRTPRSPNSRAFRPLKKFSGNRYFGIGVFYAVPRGDERLLRDARKAQRDLLERCLHLGGRPYLCGAHDLDENGIESIYGEEYEEVEQMRDRLDPDGLFNRPPNPARLPAA
jgi:FAD/FMN-containing dehydrogenase